MRCPCEICVEASICRGATPCRKRKKYDEWKEKAREINEKRRRK